MDVKKYWIILDDELGFVDWKIYSTIEKAKEAIQKYEKDSISNDNISSNLYRKVDFKTLVVESLELED